MDFSEIIFAIVLGLFAGAIGKLLMPGDDPGGVVVTILLGLAGSFVGFLLFTKVLGIGDDSLRLGRRHRRGPGRDAAARGLPGSGRATWRRAAPLRLARTASQYRRPGPRGSSVVRVIDCCAHGYASGHDRRLT